MSVLLIALSGISNATDKYAHFRTTFWVRGPSTGASVSKSTVNFRLLPDSAVLAAVKPFQVAHHSSVVDCFYRKGSLDIARQIYRSGDTHIFGVNAFKMDGAEVSASGVISPTVSTLGDNTNDDCWELSELYHFNLMPSNATKTTSGYEFVVQGEVRRHVVETSTGTNRLITTFLPGRSGEFPSCKAWLDASGTGIIVDYSNNGIIAVTAQTYLDSAPSSETTIAKVIKDGERVADLRLGGAREVSYLWGGKLPSKQELLRHYEGTNQLSLWRDPIKIAAAGTIGVAGLGLILGQRRLRKRAVV